MNKMWTVLTPFSSDLRGFCHVPSTTTIATGVALFRDYQNCNSTIITAIPSQAPPPQFHHSSTTILLFHHHYCITTTAIILLLLNFIRLHHYQNHTSLHDHLNSTITPTTIPSFHHYHSGHHLHYQHNYIAPSPFGHHVTTGKGKSKLPSCLRGMLSYKQSRVLLMPATSQKIRWYDLFVMCFTRACTCNALKNIDLSSFDIRMPLLMSLESNVSFKTTKQAKSKKFCLTITKCKTVFLYFLLHVFRYRCIWSVAAVVFPMWNNESY